MGPNRKPLRPHDRAVAEILRRELEASGKSLRALEAATGISTGRLWKIMNFETPPIAIGEISVIAAVFGIRGSAVMAEAEAAVSDLDPTMYALAARADDDDDEAAAQQIDP